MLRRRKLVATVTASLSLVAVQLWQIPAASAGGAPVCADAEFGDDEVGAPTVQTPDVCPYVDYESVIESVLPPDPGVWAAMPATAKGLFLLSRQSTGPNVIEPDVGTDAVSGTGVAGRRRNCGAYTVTVKGENSVGGVLYTYQQTLRNCWNGRNVVKSKRTRLGETSTPGWSYEGHIASERIGRVPAARIGRFTQGKFVLRIVYQIQEANPYIWQWRYADGDKPWSTG